MKTYNNPLIKEKKQERSRTASDDNQELTDDFFTSGLPRLDGKVVSIDEFLEAVKVKAGSKPEGSVSERA